MKTVLGLIGNKSALGAVEVYRISMPFKYLNKHKAARCGWMPMREAAKRMARNGVRDITGHDVIVMHKKLSHDEDAGKFIDSLRSHGATIVYETDDDYSGEYRRGEVTGKGTWKPLIHKADAVTVTTEHLAQMVRDDGAEEVHVIPNAIDYDWFTAVSESALDLFQDELTIMLAGTRTHAEDWRVLSEVIPDITADYDHVKFLAATVRSYYPYLEDKVMWIRPCEYGKYPALLRQADILLAPLVPDDRFNWSKTPIKAIEGWCAKRSLSKTRQGGCAIIATDCPVYRGTVQNRHNGLLVDHTPEAWDGALRLLIEDWRLRQKVQRFGLKDAQRFDIAERWVDWQRAYDAITNGGET